MSRIENIVEYHPDLLNEWNTKQGKVYQIACQLMGEDVILYKDKCNMKLPGDTGFEAHQRSDPN